MTDRHSTPEELRAELNRAAIALVASGFAIIDAGCALAGELTERTRNELKKAVIRGISPPRNRRRKGKA